MKSNKFSISIAAALLLTFVLTVAGETLSGTPGESIIRLHILANSDSADDQQLKLAVRDRILREVTALCGETVRPDKYLIGHQDEVRAIAEDEIRAHGYAYPVTVEYGRFYFPVKQYDNYVFPAGMYDGMRILIGSGAGQNWWCVMYPPLCFTSETKGSVPDDSRARLSQSAELYENGGQVVVRPKFKVKEWWDELAG